VTTPSDSRQQTGGRGVDAMAARMYTHAHLPQAQAAQLREYVLENRFAHLITGSVEAGLHCTAVVVVPESTQAEAFALVGHLARRNPHAAALSQTGSALLLFQGPHAYISPRWYRNPDVPTWDYVAVQVRGTIEPVDDLTEVERILKRTIEYAERGAATPWTLEQAPAELKARLLTGIRGFRVQLQRAEGTFKLSQNKTDAERATIVEALLASGRDGDTAIASLIKTGFRR